MPTASGSGDPKDPLNYVQGTSYAYDWTSPSTVEPLVTGGTLAPTSTWQDGRLGGNVYRFVTWVDDPCPVCTGTQDYKRVTVAVTVTTGPLRVSPFLATTFVRRP
jgi:hypothetical protein